MRESKFLCIGWLPILLCSLLLLALTSAFKFRDIEEKVADSTKASLSEKKYSWAKVETFNRGRDVLITGTAPTAEAKSDVIALAKNAYGVRNATYAGTIAATTNDLNATNTLDQEPNPATTSLEYASTEVEAPKTKPVVLIPAHLNAASDGSKVTLSGRLSSQREADKLIANATRVFGANNVVNNLTVSDGTSELASIDFMGSLKFDTEGPSNVNAAINENGITLAGNVASGTLSQSIEESVSSRYDGAINNQLVVSVPVIEENICQKQVNDILAQGKINFETAKSSISQSSYDLLDRVYQTAKTCPEAAFEVAGHTDSTGNLNFNMTLSQRRAQAVVDYLIQKGLSSDRLKAAGYGPERPIASNASEQGRAKNRRIEFKLNN